jgi:hypothetical protein
MLLGIRTVGGGMRRFVALSSNRQISARGNRCDCGACAPHRDLSLGRQVSELVSDFIALFK